MIDPPSGGAPEKAPRWDLRGTKVVAGEIGFRGDPGWFRGTWVYIGGICRSARGPRGWGRALGEGAPPCLVASLLLS